MKFFTSKKAQNLVGEDVFVTWMNIMKSKGIESNDEVIEHLNTWNDFKYQGWEIVRWTKRTRNVPRAAFEAMVAEVFYWVTTGDIYKTKFFHRKKFDLIKKMVIRRTKKGVAS